jgi:DnaD/phage-associated family protein
MKKQRGEKNDVSSLLIDDKPLVVLPSLAVKIGLSESIFIQQLHYWLKDSNNIKDGFKWVYNTYEDWSIQFPFWSISTIRRIITKLEKANLIIIGNYNQLKIDNTKWYRINYEMLEDMSRPPVQNEQTECSEWTEEEVNLNRPLPEITTEITTEIKNKKEEAPARDVNPFEFFEQNGFGVIGGYIAEKIGQWCDDLSPELVLEAMKIAVERSVKNWSYVERILRDWSDKKFKTVEQVHAAILAFRENRAKQRDKPKNGYRPKRTEILPDWFDDEQQKRNEITAKENVIDEELKRKELNDLLNSFKGDK